jgi:radical SAM protein with 4Fe4S-binding SPASM domain
VLARDAAQRPLAEQTRAIDKRCVLEPLLETIIAHGVHGWQLMLTVAMGRAVDEPEVLAQPYDLLVLFPLLDKLKQRCDEAGVRLWPGNNLGYFGPFESRLRGSLPRGHGTSCGAGRGTLGIEADGAIKGCPSLPGEAWVGGNVRERPLREIWERAPALRYTRDRTVDDLWGFCRDCYCWRSTRRACWRVRRRASGSVARRCSCTAPRLRWRASRSAPASLTPDWTCLSRCRVSHMMPAGRRPGARTPARGPASPRTRARKRAPRSAATRRSSSRQMPLWPPMLV